MKHLFFIYIHFDLFLKSSFTSAEGGSVDRQKETSQSSPDTPQRPEGFDALSPDDQKEWLELQERFQTAKYGIDYNKQAGESLEKALLEKGDPQDKEYREIEEQIRRYRTALERYSQDISEVKTSIDTLLGNLRQEIRTLSSRETQFLSTIENSDFLRIPFDRRLQYVTQPHIDTQDVANGSVKELQFNFTFNGTYNEALYLQTTAGQVLPPEIGSLRCEDIEYVRKGLKGEFFDANNNRLVIHQGTQLQDFSYRGVEDLATLSQENDKAKNEFMEKNPNADESLVSQAIERGIDPKMVQIALGGQTLTPQQQEAAFTQMERIRGDMKESGMIDVKSQTGLAYLLSVLLEFLGFDKVESAAKEFGLNEEQVAEAKARTTHLDSFTVQAGTNETLPESIAERINITANNLGISPLLVKAIMMQESAGRFGATRFEQHVYNREMKKGNSSHDASMLATSYGAFQIMGFNYKACGYDSVGAFVDAMQKPAAQFMAFENFVRSNPTLHAAMREKNYNTIAYHYNGPKYAQNNYNNAIAARVRSYSSDGMV